MSSCYRCGRDLPEGQVECEEGCKKASSTSVKNPPVVSGDDTTFEFAYIDWTKVKTLDDLIKVLAVINAGSGICTDDEDYEKIKHLCEPPVKLNIEGDEI